MRFMMIVKANPESEAGKMPSEALLAEMMRYNGQLVQAGVLREAAGLKPSAQGVRATFAGGTKTLVEGPYPRHSPADRRLLDHRGGVARGSARLVEARAVAASRRRRRRGRVAAVLRARGFRAEPGDRSGAPPRGRAKEEIAARYSAGLAPWAGEPADSGAATAKRVHPSSTAAIAR